jgi:DNA-binding NarL/FixJ family response regulator
VTYENFKGRSGTTAREREQLVAALTKKGHGLHAIAYRVGITPRSVQRIKKRLAQREGTA